ncbi:unnamed protein product [Rotaria socialis]|uniref:Uncharacterized protein n=1 Tax=Rotaria socialis TaxID=392032 RepID=A0A817YH48_9BILA|nr:unnamed protein product [Rotaria socialis]
MYIQRLLIQQEAERRAQQSIEIDIDEDIFLLSSSIVIEYFLSVGANLDFDISCYLNMCIFRFFNLLLMSLDTSTYRILFNSIENFVHRYNQS